MRNPEFELFCQLMYAEYCDEKDSYREKDTLKYSEYRQKNIRFLEKEFEERYGSVSTIHSQE